MSTLIFLLTVATMIGLLVTVLVRVGGRKPIGRVGLWGGGLLLGYCLVWGGFWLARRYPVVPFGTEICFDDWCATVDSAKQVPSLARDSVVFRLAMTMSNHARGIAQRPCEPRVRLIDDRGRVWLPATWGAVPFDARLEVHESKRTTVDFVVPKEGCSLEALIEEGPWITELIFPEDEAVFRIR